MNESFVIQGHQRVRKDVKLRIIRATKRIQQQADLRGGYSNKHSLTPVDKAFLFGGSQSLSFPTPLSTLSRRENEI